MQKGDVGKTFADIDKSIKKLKYKPVTTIKKGIPTFLEWFKSHKF